MLIEPKEVGINGKRFIISKIPATHAVEIMAKGGIALTLQRGDYSLIEAMMLKAMNYVAIRREGQNDLILSSRELVDNHCVNYKTYLTVLEAVREYNEGFFVTGSLSDFSKNLIQTLPMKIIGMFKQSSPPSSMPDAPLSTN